MEGEVLGAEGVQQLGDPRILSGVTAASEPGSCSLYPEMLPEWILAVRDPSSCSDTTSWGWLWSLFHLPGKAGGGINLWGKQNFSAVLDSPAEEVLQFQTALLLVLGSLQPQLLNPSSSHQLPGENCSWEAPHAWELLGSLCCIHVKNY